MWPGAAAAVRERRRGVGGQLVREYGSTVRGGQARRFVRHQFSTDATIRDLEGSERMATGKGSAAPLPGQTMDLDAISGGEEGSDILGDGEKESGGRFLAHQEGGWRRFLMAVSEEPSRRADQGPQGMVQGRNVVPSNKVKRRLCKDDLTGKIRAGQEKLHQVETAFEDILTRIGKPRAGA